MSHDNSSYNPNNERRKRIEKYHETHEHNPKTGYMEKKKTVAKKMSKDKVLEKRSKKAGFYVHGHKNFGDVYEK